MRLSFYNFPSFGEFPGIEEQIIRRPVGANFFFNGFQVLIKLTD
jgi:hypothetical protein